MSHYYKSFKVLFFFLFLSIQSIVAQIPAGYYADAEGKEGYALKTELFFIIDNHNDRGYSALWTLYYDSDAKPNGKVWDMYSDVPGGTPPYEYTFGSDQCGNYSGEGSCYNREHSFPKSWFNDGSPMVNDAHHIVPTDGYVNGQRGSFPFGEVGSASWTSQNGSKKGSSSVAGYSGTVFEPIDEYKGDFARIYFYMATRYQSQIDSWSSDMLNGTEDQTYTDWALSMLLEWHNADPVSQKEIDRNNEIYDYQGNRNPFVDHPEWVSCIWENSCDGSTSPSLSASTASLQFGTVEFSATPEIKNFTVTGSNLSEIATLSSNDNNFTISTSSNSGFINSLELTPDAEGVLDQTIYVQFAPAQDVSANVNGTLLIDQSEVDNINITMAGTVQEQTDPSAEITSTIAVFEANLFYDNSVESQAIDLTGSNLSSDVTITLSNGFQISSDDVDFSNSIDISPDNSGNISTTLFINYLPPTLTEGNFSGELTVGNNGQTLQTLDLSANIYSQDNSIVLSASVASLEFGSIYFGETAEIQSFELTGSGLTETATLSSNAGEFLIAQSENGDYGNSLVLTPNNSGELNETIFVQFLAIENTTESIISSISITQPEVQDFEVSVSGSVKEIATPDVSLTNSPEVFNTNIFYNTEIQEQEIDFHAVGILNSLEINATNGFKISLDNTQFTENIELETNEDREVIDQLWINFQPENLTAGNYAGELNFVSENENLLTLTLTAELIDQDTSIVLSFVKDTIFTTVNEPIYELKVQAQRILDEPLNFQIRLSDFNNIFYPAQFTTTPEADGTLMSLNIPENDSIAVIQLVLDTAKLKTNTEKSFLLSILSSDDYNLGETTKLVVDIAPHGNEVTANKFASEQSFVVYPNPTNDYLQVENVSTSAIFNIYNIHGKKVKSGNVNHQKIEVQELEKGLYYLQLTIDGRLKSKAVKFIKQ
ncbi:endonuclease [Marivirga sp. S37H4]|uniref:Endonuclease n=1 Tax=Marivirga aurantiaca TaxID=2802615 RepID=A0A934WXN8_9BACT|nr:endonuclease [Marivirga aurantiaca]MBK6265058.1 endonuclease [Marivirga aurantiaca]